MQGLRERAQVRREPELPEPGRRVLEPERRVLEPERRVLEPERGRPVQQQVRSRALRLASGAHSR